MARRRLTDLLREEAQKTTEVTVDTMAAPIESASDASSVGATNASTDLVELEGALAHLNHGLEAAQQRETNFQEQIDYLHADLKEQKQLVQKLQAELKQAQQAQAELERTKQVILQLSEVNTKLTQANAQLTQEVADLKQLKAEAIQPQPKSQAIQSQPKSQAIQPQSQLQPYDYRSQRSGIKPLPHHSIRPRTPVDRSNKLDLGWAD